MLSILIITAVALLALYLYLSAALYKPTMREGEFPEQKVCYYELTGNYSKIYWPTITSISDTLKTMGIQNPEKLITFGIYYDIPGTKPDSELSSVVGFVLPSDFNMENRGDEKLKFQTLKPIKRALLIDYPFRSPLCIKNSTRKCYKILADFWNSQPKGTPGTAIGEFYGFRKGYTTFVESLDDWGEGITKCPHDAEQGY